MMQQTKYLVRFFRAVPPVPPLMLWTFAATDAVAAALIVVDPDRAARALAPVLVLQLFAASSGFAGPARRGYYDLLLTRGHGRWLIAAMHWLLSIAPGILSWLTLAAVEMLTRPGSGAALLASGTCAAMLLLSTLPWALTTGLPRFAGGVGWLLVLVTVATIVSGGDAPEWAWAIDRHGSIGSALVFLIYPASAVGRQLTAQDVWSVAPGVIVAIGAMMGAWRWISWADFPLEAAQ